MPSARRRSRSGRIRSKSRRGGDEIGEERGEDSPRCVGATGRGVGCVARASSRGGSAGRHRRRGGRAESRRRRNIRRVSHSPRGRTAPAAAAAEAQTLARVLRVRGRIRERARSAHVRGMSTRVRVRGMRRRHLEARPEQARVSHLQRKGETQSHPVQTHPPVRRVSRRSGATCERARRRRVTRTRIYVVMRRTREGRRATFREAATERRRTRRSPSPRRGYVDYSARTPRSSRRRFGVSRTLRVL